MIQIIDDEYIQCKIVIKMDEQNNSSAVPVFTKISYLLLRLSIGWLFFYAGWTKVITFFTDDKNWSATGFLSHLEGPFADMFSGMANSLVVDYLNAYGLLFVGIALMLGILTRWSSFCGAILMLLYYFPGYPPEHAFIIDDHLIYVLIFLVFIAVGIGKFYGIDGAIRKSGFSKKHPWVNFLFS